MEINLGKLAFDIDFHPSDYLVATGLIDGDLHLYRYSPDSVPVRQLEVHAHTESCRAVRFINDVVMLFIFDVVYDFCLGYRERSCCNSFNAHEDYISDMTFASDARKLLTTRTLSVCNLRRNTVQTRSEFSEDELLSVVLMKVDEDRIIGSENGIIKIIQPIAEHSDCPIECLAFSHDRKFLGSIAHDQMLKSIKKNLEHIWNKRKNANNEQAFGGSNNFFADL
uniref:Uncharacterized protein n=1 Tax=Phaseolus vulgaris TaxID=3885 RepID=V7AED5_PHAVU|nr:hypothetical protein PHAVU_011G028500g [Phaseolus vulgaris]ESW03615.1 hypothetical protein PHAVU_011G028500g [Phaseolus vulgaris]